MNRLSAIESFLLRRAASVLSGRGAHRSLLILIYHRVLVEADPLLPDEPDAAAFEAIADLLADHFNVLPLREAGARLAAGSLPDRALCITFDDGYANNLAVAEPILASRRLPATVFVATGYLNGGRMFNDTVIEAVRHAGDSLDLTDLGLGRFELRDAAAKRGAIAAILPRLKYRPLDERRRAAESIAERVGARLPDDLMLTDEQVRELHRRGVEIGAHTVDHPILANVAADRARDEMAGSKRRLEQIIGGPVATFAYPNGRPGQDYHAIHARLARETGFSLAVSTAWGAATRASDPYQLPRIAPWDRTAIRYSARLLKAFREHGSAVA
jgi:peptidoglycan/xylan/chitin deacetylase (PgdA/CDA1 family)